MILEYCCKVQINLSEKDVFITTTTETPSTTTPAKIETSSTTPAMSTALATTIIKTIEALTTRTNSDEFNKQLSFSTKTVVDLEIEWKSDFADRNSQAFLEVEKRILDVFENLREGKEPPISSQMKIFRFNNID